MSIFYFKVDDLETVLGIDEGYEFPDLMSAISEGKRVLAEMAVDGIPHDEGKRLVVEVCNAERVPIAQLSLEFHISFIGQGGS